MPSAIIAFSAIPVGWMNSVSIFGLAFTLLGLWMTYRQARAAKKKAIAAEGAATSLKDAVQSATRRIARQDLIGAIGQMKQLITQLDNAEQSGNAAFAQQALLHIAHHVSQIQVLMEKDATGLVPDEVGSRLSKVKGWALDVKARIAKDTYGKASAHLGGIKGELDSLSAELVKFETSAKYDSEE